MTEAGHRTEVTDMSIGEFGGGLFLIVLAFGVMVTVLLWLLSKLPNT